MRRPCSYLQPATWLKCSPLFHQRPAPPSGIYSLQPMTLSDEELKASRVSTDINETVLRDAQTTCPCMLGDTGSSWSHPNTPRKLKKYRNHKHARPRSSAGADRKQSLAKASGPGKSDASPRPKHSKSCQLRIVHGEHLLVILLL